MSNPFQNAAFWLGVAEWRQMPPDTGCEVAFAGRSNVGKSSAINVVTGRKDLARTSKTPGRTQQINFFQLGDDRRLVDLPGYGYAKVPLPLKKRWQQLLARYLSERESLRGVVVLMDCRHLFTEFDTQMIAWCRDAQMPAHVVLTKADKLKRGPAASALVAARRQLESLYGEEVVPDGSISLQLFSSLKKQGVDSLREVLTGWLGAG